MGHISKYSLNPSKHLLSNKNWRVLVQPYRLLYPVHMSRYPREHTWPTDTVVVSPRNGANQIPLPVHVTRQWATRITLNENIMNNMYKR